MDKKLNRKQENDDVIDLTGVTGLKRVYDYLPYTACRIKRILHKHYGVHLHPIGSYKCNRVPNYHQHYWVVSDETNEILMEDMTLETLRYAFARLDYPLYDEYSAVKKSKRNAGAENFLKAVQDLYKNNID